MSPSPAPRRGVGRPGALARLGLPLLAAAILVAGAPRRFRAVDEFRNFAGDGWQYYHLARQVVLEGRYAFGPAPLPPAFSRLPGYPLFVAAAGYGAPRFNEQDVALRVARAQVVLDLLTALLALLLAAELGLRAPPLLALALCVASPLLAMCTTYILSETVAIFLTTLVLYLLARAARRRLLLHLGAAGAVLGAALLVRADSVTLAPAFAAPLLLAPVRLRTRVAGGLVAVLAATAVFAPWPVRNVLRTGAPHVFGSEWVTMAGDPLPSGIQAWLATWAVDPLEAAEVAWQVAKSGPVATSELPEAAFDSKVEKKRVLELFDAYNRGGVVTEAVEAGFRKVARERRARDPLRYFVKLPVRRAYSLWITPVPDWEMPIASGTLALPSERERLGPLTERTLILAGLGLLFAIALPRGRAVALAIALAALSRTFVVGLVLAGGTQRYSFELLPSALALAAVALLGPAEILLYRLFPALDGGATSTEGSAALRARPKRPAPDTSAPPRRVAARPAAHT